MNDYDLARLQVLANALRQLLETSALVAYQDRPGHDHTIAYGRAVLAAKDALQIAEVKS